MNEREIAIAKRVMRLAVALDQQYWDTWHSTMPKKCPPEKPTDAEVNLMCLEAASRIIAAEVARGIPVIEP